MNTIKSKLFKINFFGLGLPAQFNAPFPPYFMGGYTNYVDTLKHSYEMPPYQLSPPQSMPMQPPSIPMQPQPIPIRPQSMPVSAPNYWDLNYKFHELKSKCFKKKLNNVTSTDFSTTSLKTTTTQTIQKKRENRRKRKSTLSINSSNDTADHNTSLSSSSNIFPVKEERPIIKINNNIPVKYKLNNEKRTDIGPAYVDVTATETDGKYNFKIALKMKNPETNSTISNSVSSEDYPNIIKKDPIKLSITNGSMKSNVKKCSTQK